MIHTAKSAGQSASRNRQSQPRQRTTNQRTSVMKKLLFALLPGIISRILKARKAKQLRAGQTRPPRNRF
jgi:hypothetical protein